MPNKGQDQTFQDLAMGDPEIVVTTDDLESGDQFEPLDPNERVLWTNAWLEVKAS
jgi:hypothetical protein